MGKIKTRGRWLQGGLTLALLLSMAAPAAAFQFTLGESVQGSLDTTVSYGLSYRTAERDKDIIGIRNGGRAYSVNGDDGNLNYDDDDYFSKVFKVTSDLELKYQNFGLFLRGSAFHDFVNSGGDGGERTEITDHDALDLVGEDAKLLDAFLWWDFEAGGMPGTLKVGEQVLSWGESTFIQNGINIINPVDVSMLRLPGSELKEALIPVGMVSASLSLNENVSIEGFYQYDWEKTVVDPVGSYWSVSDLVGDGATKILLGFGGVPDSLPVGSGFAAPRGATENADDDGQYGLALHLLAPELNNTELGFYFINYHSRLPVISARTGPVVNAAYVASVSYFTEYPEDIKLYGVSFNTQFDSTGIALQGEYSYREDAPLQIDDVEILFAALSPTNPSFGRFGQLGPYATGKRIQGYEEMDISQAQMTATKAFGPTFGADQFTLVGEAGVTHVHNMPSKDRLRFDSPGTYISGNQRLAAAHAPTAAGKYEKADAFADATSWGYRAVAKLDFNNAIGAVSLSPRVAWAHDVDGNSPNPGGNFLEHRKAVTVGVEASYQNAWSADLSYTDFFGAGRYNLINDRDFISFNVKYSF